MWNFTKVIKVKVVCRVQDNNGYSDKRHMLQNKTVLINVFVI